MAPAGAAHHGAADTAGPQRVKPIGSALCGDGGEALDGHRFMYWNFVSSRKERISQAAEDWEAQRFAKVPGETDWIPLPPKKPSA
ncbi:conserved hypothetical protein [Ricinus communis]|uniref:Pirin C-terminal domain-containing protein n=1 Tax=Ricinus communis TaxID=3988 RepID=B9TCA9_RICCO|nr:conserved hypothetical protein [Ricinus communis]